MCFYMNHRDNKSPHDRVANVLDWNIIVSSNSRHAITFPLKKYQRENPALLDIG